MPFKSLITIALPEVRGIAPAEDAGVAAHTGLGIDHARKANTDAEQTLGRFPSDNTANSLLTREYRKPYIVPEQV